MIRAKSTSAHIVLPIWKGNVIMAIYESMVTMREIIREYSVTSKPLVYNGYRAKAE